MAPRTPTPARRVGAPRAAPAEAVRQITMVEILASRLRAAIVDGNLPPGSRLGTKVELARRYGVSTGTVHAAVRLLEAQGLAVGRPGVGGGLFVSHPRPYLGLTSILLTLHETSDQVSVRDLLDTRVSLDVLLARRAAERRRAADVPLLRDALAALEAEGRRKPLDVALYMGRDWGLHDCIAQAAQSPTLLAVYRTIAGFINTQVQDIRPQPNTVPAVPESLAIHRGIVESIVKGDTDAATRFAEAHRQRVVKRFSL